MHKVYNNLYSANVGLSLRVIDLDSRKMAILDYVNSLNWLTRFLRNKQICRTGMNTNKFEFRPWPIHIGLVCPFVSEKKKQGLSFFWACLFFRSHWTLEISGVGIKLWTSLSLVKMDFQTFELITFEYWKAKIWIGWKHNPFNFNYILRNFQITRTGINFQFSSKLGLIVYTGQWMTFPERVE